MPVGAEIATVQFGKSVPLPNRLKCQVILTVAITALLMKRDGSVKSLNDLQIPLQELNINLYIFYICITIYINCLRKY